jgi:anti-sigma-K factor RskA
MNEKEQEEMLSLTGSYVLNALEPEEKAEFEAYLKTSPQARQEVTELSDTASLLSNGILEVKPSATMKQSLMERIAVTPQLPASEMQQVVSQVSEVAKPETKVQEKVRKRWFNRVSLAGFPVAVAASLIVVFAMSGTYDNQIQNQSTEANALASISQAADNQRTSVNVKDGGTATVVWSDSKAASAIFMKDMPSVGNDKNYQLWLISKDGVAKSAGLVSKKSVERGWQVLDGTLERGSTIGVTVEPKGGSKSPTTAPVALVKTT